jgi:threonylcarbamoyladenosine tRNA methylthiotransferase MtaB
MGIHSPQAKAEVILRICIETLGCRTNQADSSRLAEALVAHGHSLVASAREADILLVNTCTVTHGAHRDVRKTVRRARRGEPTTKVVLVGCLGSAYPDAAEVAMADAVVPGTDPDEVLRMVDRFSTPPLACETSGPPLRRFPLERREGLARFHLKVGEGCDQGCTYCIVPRARGKPRSRTPDEILAEARQAIEAGFPELVLTATHVMRYGQDLRPVSSLPELMAALVRLPEGGMLRLCSLEPDEGFAEVLEGMASHPRWCHHLHLSVQHACDTVLSRMGRRYGFDSIQAMVESARRLLPDAGIGLDVIVGFPEESDQEFQQCEERLATLDFSYLHVFPFSLRPGSRLDRPGVPLLDSRVVRTRVRRLVDLSRSRHAAFMGRFIGEDVTVVVETRRNPVTGALTGVSGNYLRVEFPGGNELMGRRVRCAITGMNEGVLLGRELNSNEGDHVDG